MVKRQRFRIDSLAAGGTWPRYVRCGLLKCPIVGRVGEPDGVLGQQLSRRRAKQERHRDLFTWDFIGALQSRKLKDISPNVRLIHSVASESALRRLGDHPAPAVLLQVNVAGEEGKAGIAPEELDRYLELSAVKVVGLMTMPPWSDDPEASRPYFRQLRELAQLHGLPQVSMGMSHDLETAIEEGATCVRVGTALFEEYVYGDDGNLLTQSYMDYLIPTSMEVPEITIGHCETPSPWTSTRARNSCGPLVAGTEPPSGI